MKQSRISNEKRAMYYTVFVMLVETTKAFCLLSEDEAVDVSVVAKDGDETELLLSVLMFSNEAVKESDEVKGTLLAVAPPPPLGREPITSFIGNVPRYLVNIVCIASALVWSW